MRHAKLVQCTYLMAENAHQHITLDFNKRRNSNDHKLNDSLTVLFDDEVMKISSTDASNIRRN